MGDSAGKEVRLAVEGDVAHTAKEAVHRRVHEPREQLVGALSEVRDQPQDGLQVGGAVSSWMRARRPVTPAASQSDGRGSLARGCNRDGTTAEAQMGAEKAASVAFASQSRIGIAEHKHLRAHLQAQRAGNATAPPSSDATVVGATGACHSAQRGLVHGLQG